MKHFAGSLALCFWFALSARGQSDAPRGYQNFPIIVTLQFHAFAVPFHDLKSNFRNVGIGLGTEVSYTGNQKFVQQLSVVWYRNKTIGNGWLVYTQPVWRPGIGDNFYAELKAGIGYLLASRPAPALRQTHGEWKTSGHRGKGMLTLPVGISVGGNVQTSGQAMVSPFVSYQLLVVSGYNKSVPAVPETLVQVGSRIHF
jgi:hypothetical protein